MWKNCSCPQEGPGPLGLVAGPGLALANPFSVPCSLSLQPRPETFVHVVDVLGPGGLSLTSGGTGAEVRGGSIRGDAGLGQVSASVELGCHKRTPVSDLRTPHSSDCCWLARRHGHQALVPAMPEPDFQPTQPSGRHWALSQPPPLGHSVSSVSVGLALGDREYNGGKKLH